MAALEQHGPEWWRQHAQQADAALTRWWPDLRLIDGGNGAGGTAAQPIEVLQARTAAFESLCMLHENFIAAASGLAALVRLGYRCGPESLAASPPALQWAGLVLCRGFSGVYSHPARGEAEAWQGACDVRGILAPRGLLDDSLVHRELLRHMNSEAAEAAIALLGAAARHTELLPRLRPLGGDLLHAVAAAHPLSKRILAELKPIFGPPAAS